MDPRQNQLAGTVLFSAVIIILLLIIIKFFNISYPISVTNQTVSGELSVVGTGQVDVVPNSATVSVGVVANGKTAQEVQTSISATNNKIVAAVEKQGVAKKDIKTTNYSVNPTYNFTNGQNNIDGYSGNATLTIKVKNTSNLTPIITAATEAGANQIFDTQYVVDSPEKYQEEARNKAIANAKEQAAKLSKQLGIRLGKVINIAESSSNTSPMYPMPFAKQTLDSAGGGVANLQPGSQTIVSTVTLYFQKN